jgi:hypothetical protein
MRAPASLRESEPLEPASGAPDPIDEQIASLLESVSSKHEAPLAVAKPDVRPDAKPDVRPDRVAAREKLSATAPTEAPRPRRRARSTKTRTARRPDRLSDTVKETLSGIAIEWPRPYVSYTVKMAFLWVTIALISIGVGLLIFYLMSA